MSVWSRPRQFIVAGSIVVALLAAVLVVLSSPRGGGQDRAADGSALVPGSLPPAPPGPQAWTPAAAAEDSAGRARATPERPSAATGRSPVGSCANPSVATKQAADDELLDEVAINTEVATLEVKALLEEQRGDGQAASRLRQRMAQLRGRLTPRDSDASPDQADLSPAR